MVGGRGAWAGMGMGMNTDSVINNRYNANLSGFPGLYPSTLQAVIEPNGFILIGYAQNNELLLNFELKLKENQLFGEDRVYLHIEEIEPRDMSELDNAEVGGMFAKSVGMGMGGMGMGGMQVDFGMGGMPMPMGMMGMGIMGGRGMRGVAVERPVHFRIDAQFLGDAQEFE